MTVQFNYYYDDDIWNKSPLA